MAAQLKIDYEKLDDLQLAGRVALRDPGAVRLVTQRNNQRLYRAAWSILRDRSEAEDAVQSAYLSAFAAISRFEGRSALSTWLTRIVINEALGRARAAKRRQAHLEGNSVAILEEYREKLMQGSMSGMSPDRARAKAELRQILEDAIAGLADPFRSVFVLREIEGLSIEEVAEALDLEPATVKTRHFRAREKLQRALAPEVKEALNGAFPFAGAACETMTERVVAAFCDGPGRSPPAPAGPG